MKEHNGQSEDSFSIVGTNIDEVKRLNANSGMSYNEVKEWIAKQSGGHGTASYSNTNMKNK